MLTVYFPVYPHSTPLHPLSLGRTVEEQVVLPLSKSGVGCPAVGDSLVAHFRIWVLSISCFQFQALVAIPE